MITHDTVEKEGGFLKVWLVIGYENNHESAVMKIWDNEKSAKADAFDRNKNQGLYFRTQYEVEEWAVHD